jgi:hypothetical protein
MGGKKEEPEEPAGIGAYKEERPSGIACITGPLLGAVRG